LAGVCAGIAEFVGWRAISVRLLWVIGTALSLGAGIMLYIIMSFVMPPPDNRGKFNLEDFRVQ
jgi:phage shock protein C